MEEVVEIKRESIEIKEKSVKVGKATKEAI